MLRPLILIAMASFASAAASAAERQAAPFATAVGPPGSQPAPLAPAFPPGAPVFDRAGVQVGVVQSAAETREGDVNLVVKIDGKLIGLASSTLRLRGACVVSSQTKQEMLASAGAPP